MNSDNLHLGIYLGKFQDLLDIETTAEGIYGYCIEHLEDPILLEKFKEIYKDEQEHIKIVQGFIETISGQYKSSSSIGI